MFDDLAKELDRGEGETNLAFTGGLVGNPTTENNQYLDGFLKTNPLEPKIAPVDGLTEEESRRNKENQASLGHFQRIKRRVLDMLPIKGGKRKRGFTKETVKYDEDKNLLAENSSLSSKRLKSTVNEELPVMESDCEDENRRLVGDSPDSVSGNTESVKKLKIGILTLKIQKNLKFDLENSYFNIFFSREIMMTSTNTRNRTTKTM